MFANFGQDVRYALRQYRKNPAYAAVAIITLALGIGVNTAVYSIVEGVVLAPLHFFNPDRLVMIWESNPRFSRVWASYPNFQDWQRTAQSFQQLAAFRQQGVDLTSPGEPAHLSADQISSNFFSTLGSQLVLGREFTAEENQPGGSPAAIISYQLWKQRFGGVSEVLGKNVTVDGVDYAVVGVAPPHFRLISDADIYTPLAQLDPLVLNNRGSHDGLFAFGRLTQSRSVSQSQAEMSNIQDGLDLQYPTDNRDLGIKVEPLKQAVVGDASKTLALLLGAVALVLLITCSNVANLALARSVARSREFSVRVALGASRARLVSQLLTENVILSLAGACVGTLFAFAAVRFLLPMLPSVLPRSEEVGLNLPVLLYTLVISLAVGIFSGLVPAYINRTAAPQAALKQGTRGSTVSHRRTQSIFVVAQISLTLVLLLSAGLLLRTIAHLRSVDPGFSTQNIISLDVGLPHSLTTAPTKTRIAYQQLIERIRQIAGVEAADFSTAVPLTGKGGYLPFWLDSHKPESLQSAPRMRWSQTGPDYLRTMGMQLLQGRFLRKQDTLNTPCVVVVDQDFASRFFPHERPIGHTITAGFAAFGPCAIVGVVNHVKSAALDDAGLSNEYQAYYSLAQVPDKWVSLNYPDASVVVRTPLSTDALVRAIKRSESDTATVYNVHTMRDILADSISEQRF
ncbi:MAG TPA: ABC transporter permease, partial [Terriglobales bacterium]